jgi:DNA-binding transcriptional MerR regulator
VKRFSISDIENLTGIKAHTIRVWEQRYNFFTPKRTETNIRYYDDQDLCMFLNIATLNENGYKISKISKMNSEEINQLVASLKENHYNTNIQVQMLSNAMLKMDDDEFDEILGACIREMGMEAAVSEIVFPFLRKVGFMWQVGTINPAHEHFATHKIEQKIIYCTTQFNKKINKQGKRYLLFLPPNEHHQVGLLFAQYMLRSNGHHVLYLGQNLPYDSLTEVVNYYEPDFVLSVLTVLNTDTDVDDAITKIKAAIGEIPLILTGSLITNQETNKSQKIIIVKNIAEFASIIEKLNMSIAS